MAKNGRKWPKMVENGLNPTRIKLILPGKNRTGSTSADPLKIGPPEPPPPFPLALNVKHQLHFQIPKRSLL